MPIFIGRILCIFFQKYGGAVSAASGSIFNSSSLLLAEAEAKNLARPRFTTLEEEKQRINAYLHNAIRKDYADFLKVNTCNFCLSA